MAIPVASARARLQRLPAATTRRCEAYRTGAALLGALMAAGLLVAGLLAASVTGATPALAEDGAPTCDDIGPAGLARFVQFQSFIAACRAESGDKSARSRSVLVTAPQRTEADTAYYGSHARPRAIYIKDDRIDAEFLEREISHSKLASIAKAVRATGAIVARSDLTRDGNNYRLRLRPYQVGAHPLCANERFAEQKVGANCSGFLVAPNLFVTAGHCVTWSEVSEDKPEDGKWAVVFGFQTRLKQPIVDFRDKEQVFFIRRVIERKKEPTAEGKLDYAIVELDGDVPAATAEPMRLADRLGMTVAPDTPLGVIGHPSGLPKKLSFEGRSRAMETGNRILFRAQLNTFQGNSGSPVLLYNEPDVVVGILVAGEEDFKIDETVQPACARYAVYTNGEQCKQPSGQVERCAEKVTKIGLVSQFVPESRP